jgi:hypothetical protein
MTARIYPSQQDTNLTAKGSIILTISPNINNVELYVNNTLVNVEYSTVTGLYSYNVNIGDIVRIIPSSIIGIDIIRKDYTTDDNNGNNGIINTTIIGTFATGYTFTASTVNSGYNFEYIIGVGNYIITPTPVPTSTPTPVPTFTITPTPSPTPLPITTGSLFFYDPGNLNSYPGSGSVLYDLSGNGRNASINTGITWVSGSAAYFDLNGNDNNSITGTTLNLSPTSWSMWIAVYRNNRQNYDGFMAEGTTDPISNGLYQFQISNNLDLRYHNGTQFIETGSGTLTTGSWNFIGGSIGTQRTRHIYKSGSLSNVSEAITPATSSFNEAIFIGEDPITGQDRTMNGRIGPVIMFDRELTTGELSDLDNYFKTRYGI